LAPQRLSHHTVDLASAAGQDEAATATEQWLDDDGTNGGVLLINNSGFGSYGPFPEPGFERTLEMLDLNARAPVVLTGRLLSRLQERGGGVVNISSTAAFQPTPLMSVYGATKAFLMNWSLGLWSDLRGTNVRVLCVCPGPTSSNFFRAAGFLESPVDDAFGQTSAQVVDESLRALSAGKPLLVSGWKNRFLTAISSRLPRVLVTKLTCQTMEKLRMKPRVRQQASAEVRS
jgi:short-subunit dehydrogenase